MISPQSARTNIILAMTAKLASMAVSLVSVPLLLQLLGTHTYGTWATLTSLIAFIGLLDLGVGNSLLHRPTLYFAAPARCPGG